MIDQVRALLRDREFTHAVIIDDAFDDRPRVGDIEPGLWGRFFDDLTDDEVTTVAQAYGTAAYDAADEAGLLRDQRFVDTVWKSRSVVPTAAALFQDFERVRRHKRDELVPLQELLQRDLGLECATFGRDEGADIANADIVFLDLFLGYVENGEAVARAVERVRHIVAGRRGNPPSVVLLSASPRLQEVGPVLRDKAELLGCQFRMVRKSELPDSETLVERLFELATSYPDALKLNSFLLSWDRALDDARSEFLRSIRTLDLADYANMQALILEAEGEPVGDYILDLYDLHLHSVLEGDAGLVRAAKALNEIDWTGYPPAQFMPSGEAIAIMDGALSHNQVRTELEAEIDGDPTKLRLGDVLLGPELTPAAPAAGQPEAETTRHAYVVLSQACDLQHGEADRVILLRGRVRPYGWKYHSKAQGPRTPVMIVGEQRLSIEWDVLTPETWLLAEIPAKVAEGYRRVRRLRTPFALQLQQAFIGRLGRVGTIAALPGRYAAGVRVFLRDRNGTAKLLAETQAEAEQAVCLVGRTEKNALKEWLLLSEPFQADVRRALREFPTADLPGGAPQVAQVLEDPTFFRRLKGGLPFSREGTKGNKPFKDTPHDIVQISTRARLEPDGPADRSLQPIVIEVDLA